MNRESVLELDRQDPLREFRELFDLPDGVIYLDGNSLGAVPKAVPERLQRVLDEWKQDLVGSWNSHSWIDLPSKVGEKIAPIVGAAPGQVLCADTTSVNLFKVLVSALQLKPGRHVVLSQADNFPGDLYMVQGLARLLGANRCELRLVPEEEILHAIDQHTAVVMLTHVNFRNGQRHNMSAVTRLVHDKGAIMLWDLAHSAGAMPVMLDECEVDLAVGCGYKYLNGGPGAPAFLYVASRHQSLDLQPLCGWMGHERPFDFNSQYVPVDGIQRYLCGTPSVLAMASLDAALDLWEHVSLQQIRTKSIQLGDLFIELIESNQELSDFRLSSPRESTLRGSQVSFAHPDGYAVMQALIDHKVIGDFREPDLLRFGFTPLYTRFMDVWDAVDNLREIVVSGTFREAAYQVRGVVT